MEFLKYMLFHFSLGLHTCALVVLCLTVYTFILFQFFSVLTIESTRVILVVSCFGIPCYRQRTLMD